MGETSLRAENGWLVMEPPDNPVIRIDVRVLDRVFASDSALTLALGELVVSLEVFAGMALAAELAAQLLPHTRQSRTGPCVFVGDDPVEPGTEYVRIGRYAYLIEEVEGYALAGANVPLGRGGLLQAALVMVAVRASERDGTMLVSGGAG